ncbi:hypothetical protein B0I35DRAFT_427011 [Stachybotrys elegans]|uniref:Secreted protein n=1 Tax=Stachybotrys elegans TaxID=80388 RepID=A0A8K0WTA0_9HYPO|nr:hypothetical protein B0I35DRAFT_427011 [Stachybotrys elegans]
MCRYCARGGHAILLISGLTASMLCNNHIHKKTPQIFASRPRFHHTMPVIRVQRHGKAGCGKSGNISVKGQKAGYASCELFRASG